MNNNIGTMLTESFTYESTNNGYRLHYVHTDNYMQDPTTQQGFNRYAYCMYNPLKYVDPSGERIVGWDPLYLAIMEASEVVLKRWFSDYSVAMASNELTQRLSSNLYSHGPEPPVSRLAQDFGYNLGVQNSFSLTIKHIIHLFWP